MSGSTKRARRPKHVPQRTCLVCREKMDKRQLYRLVYNDEVGLVVDPSGKLHGRGAYICHKPACWTKMAQSKLLDHALRRPITAVEKTALIDDYQTKLALHPPTEAIPGG